ncbi:MAG: 8-oxo-dGTP diphosphatase MutT [Candidatus Puniceispirillaceae bacterium]|jgi:8-oxo-dGTP diphosphatase
MAISPSMQITEADKMASSAIQLISAVALIDSDGRVLLAERPEGKIFAGYWEFPGGKIETGETPEAALVRELDEELGVDTKDSCLAPLGFVSHPYDTHHMVLLLYVCRKWSGRPQPKEGGQLKWVAPARLRDFEMPPANKELISVIQDLL